MPAEGILPAVVGAAAFLAAVFVLTAYSTASWGEFLDTYFGKAVFLTYWVSFTAAFAVFTFRPAFIHDLGVDPHDSVFYAIGVTALAGVIGAIADAISWLVRQLD